MDPFTNLSFGICAIYFDLDSRSSGIVNHIEIANLCNFLLLKPIANSCQDFVTIIPLCTKTAKDPWHLKSNIRHTAIFRISISTPTEIPENHTTSIWILPAAANYFLAPQQTTHTHQHLNPWCRAAQTRGIRFGIRANWRADRRWQLDKLKWFHSKEVRKQYETMICFFWMFNTKVRVPNNYWGGI